MYRLLALALTTFVPFAAQAECETPYLFDTVLDDLGVAESGLRSMDYATAIQTAQKMRDGMGCLEQVLPVVIAPRVMRAIAAGLYIGGEDEDATKWFRAAAYLDPGFSYGTQDLPAEHPVIRAWEGVKVDARAEPVEQEGVVLGDGKHFVDGKRVNYPVATPDAFHVYQRDYEGVHSWVIEGNAFPPEATGAIVAPVVADPEPDPAVDGFAEPMAATVAQAQVVKTNNWPAERLVLVGGGGAALVGSGVLYALSAGARGSFDSATNVAELDQYKARTNTYVVSSGVAFAAGASAVGFGALFFVIDGDPRPTFDLRF